MSLTDKQHEYLMNCNHRWNFKIGATGSGKSFLDYSYTIAKRISACRGEGLIVILGNTRGTLERNILEPMREIWSPHLIGDIKSDNTVSIFGKKVYALGADNKKHVARIQGSTIEYAYGDEVTTWSQEVFQMLKSRMRCDHSYFDGTCNPESPNHWLKTFLDSDADIYQQKYTIDDGVLPKHIVEELKKEYAGTVYYKRFIEGDWALAEGLIFPMYLSSLVDSLPEASASEYVVSIDYGTQNAFSAILWSKREGIWYGEREYYYSGRDTGIQKTDNQYADDLREWIDDIWQEQMNKPRYSILGGRGYEKIPTIIDPSAASFITLLKQSEWSKVRQADNAVKDGIRETAVALQMGRIKILKPAMPNWIKEAGGYVWDDKEEDEKPVKIADHSMDSMRYFVKTMRISRR